MGNKYAIGRFSCFKARCVFKHFHLVRHVGRGLQQPGLSIFRIDDTQRHYFSFWVGMQEEVAATSFITADVWRSAILNGAEDNQCRAGKRFCLAFTGWYTGVANTYAQQYEYGKSRIS